MSVLHVQQRESGKPAQLRRRGLLPMSLVGRDNSTMLIQAAEGDLKKAMAAADGLGRMDLEIAGEKKPRKVMIRNIDRNFIKQQVLCVTLVEVSEDDTVKLDLPVVAINVPDTEGLSFTHPTDHIKVRGKMSAMPDHVEVDLSGLEVGHHVNAGDVKLPEGIELISSPDATLFSLSVLRAVSLEPETIEPESAEETPAEEDAGEAS